MDILMICALGMCGVGSHPSEKVVQASEASPQTRGAGECAGTPLAAVSVPAGWPGPFCPWPQVQHVVATLLPAGRQH